MQETYNPSRAAKQIGVPGSTLRLWAKTYAEFLSPGANPLAGEERRLTAGDVETLKAVNQMRHNGMLPADIAQRLRNNAATGQQNAPETATIDSGTPSGENTQLAPLQSIVAVSVGKVDALGEKITDMDRRIERMEQSRSTLLIAFAAFAAGVVLVAVVVALVLAFMR